MHLFLAERKKTLSHVFISPQDILQSSGADDYLPFFLCIRARVCGRLRGCESERKNLKASSSHSKRVMGLPEWNVSHGQSAASQWDAVGRHHHFSQQQRRSEGSGSEIAEAAGPTI